MLHQRADRRDGSPPRAWGQWYGIDVDADLVRFTPTGVETMEARDFDHRHPPVHPHGRGDNTFNISGMPN